MRKKKRISKIIVLVTVLMMCFSVPAVASNYHDEAYTYYFKSTTQGVANTDLREKQDDTSAYMKCDSTTYSYTAFVLGADSLYSILYDASGGYHYTFSSGTVRKLINFVYENNLPYACIHAERNYSYNYSASGVWSPDSI